MPQLLCEEEVPHDGPIDTLHLRAAFAPTYEAWAHDRTAIPPHILTQVRPGAPVAQKLDIKTHHPILHDLKPIAEAAWVVSVLQSDAKKKFPGVEEYVDVFEDLARVLRCQTCFGTYFFNQVNPATGEQFSWTTIAQALASDPLSDLPLPPALRAYFTSSAVRPAWPVDIVPLIRSVQLASAAIGVELEAVRRQIVMYVVDLETIEGPKRLLRLGRWEALRANVCAVHRRLCRRLDRVRVVAAQTERNVKMIMALECVAAHVQAVRDKWFVSVTDRNGGLAWGWGLSERAVEVGMRLADGGDPRGEGEEREGRRVRLFEYGSGRVVPPLVQGEGEDSACDSEDDEDEDENEDL